jgi:hypothetical protein
VAVISQDLVDGLPAGAVDEAAMDEDDALHGIPLSRCSVSGSAHIGANLERRLKTE